MRLVNIAILRDLSEPQTSESTEVCEPNFQQSPHSVSVGRGNIVRPQVTFWLSGQNHAVVASCALQYIFGRGAVHGESC